MKPTPQLTVLPGFEPVKKPLKCPRCKTTTEELVEIPDEKPACGLCLAEMRTWDGRAVYTLA